MDKITVTLLGIHGLEAAYKAVKKPYKNESADGKKLLHKVAKVMKHESVLEHIIFQFDVTGSSRLELQEHMRHRMAASPTVESTRYAFKDLPHEMARLEESDDYTCFKNTLDFVRKYTVLTPEMLKDLERDFYDFTRVEKRKEALQNFCTLLLKYGADEAKYELPECFRTSFVWTINARSMLNFLKLRTSKNAHFEIRHIANLMKDLLCENEEIKGLINE